MRSVIVVLFTIFLTAIGLLIGVAVLEPLVDQTTEFDSIDNGQYSGTDIINSVLDAALVYMPLIIISGIILWALRWVLRRERVVGRR